MLSKSTTYALRAIIFLSKDATRENKIGFQKVAEELDLPAPYMGKILQQLTKNDIIMGVKGPGGGFYLEEKQKDTRLIRIIEIFDGLDYFTSCGLGLKECSETHPCPLHDDLKVFRDGLGNVFKTKTLSDLIDSVNEGKSFVHNIN